MCAAVARVNALGDVSVVGAPRAQKGAANDDKRIEKHPGERRAGDIYIFERLTLSCSNEGLLTRHLTKGGRGKVGVTSVAVTAGGLHMWTVFLGREPTGQRRGQVFYR